jgi:hypothetical protein
MPTTTLIGNPDAFDVKQGHEYLGYRQNSEYSYESGVFVLPLASREPQTVIVRVHGGLGVRRVNVAASKRGGPPILPAAVDTDRDTLISCTVNVPLPAIIQDAPSFNWTVTGEYLYVTTGIKGPRVPGKDFLPAGQYPFPLPLQDAAVEVLSAGGAGMEAVAATLVSTIPSGGYLWPFTTYPPQFMNSILLRDSNQEFIVDLHGGPGPGLGD